ncbi:MAG: CRISPR-associated endonuclease Cas2 [Syntrophorhabdus sp.]
MISNYLVCYDIRDPKRLIKVYNFLKKKALHIQYSVFYCRLTWRELVELKEKLGDLIDKRKDDVRVYPIPQDMKIKVMGRGDRIPEGIDIFIP